MTRAMKGIKPTARCKAIAARGIRSYGDVASVMAALMADIVAGRVTPAAANKISAAVGKALKKVAAP